MGTALPCSFLFVLVAVLLDALWLAALPVVLMLLVVRHRSRLGLESRRSRGLPSCALCARGRVIK